MTNDSKKTQIGWAVPYPHEAAPPQQPPQQPPQPYAQPPQHGEPYAQHQPPQYGQVQPYAQHPPPQYGQPQPYAQQPPQHAQPYAQQPPQHGQPYAQQPPQHGQPYAQHQPPQYSQPQPYAQHQPQPQPSQPQAAPRKAKPREIPGANATHGVSNRVRFIRLTYLHLLLAIVAFAGLLWLLMHNSFLITKVSVPLTSFALGGRWNWGVVLAVFMGVSWVADFWASHATSKPVQYLGLAFYVVAEALIFVPLLAIVAWKTQAIIAKGGGNPNIIRDSAYVTLGIFAALTASVFITKKDFSFMRSGLIMASGAALTLIILALTFGFNLGLAFSVAMVLLAACYILYQTSQVLAHYNPNQHVAASLALFSSVALMFWYVIRIFLRMRGD